MAIEELIGSTWKLHHIGIPVWDLDKSLEDYKAVGAATFKTCVPPRRDCCQIRHGCSATSRCSQDWL